MSATVHVLLLIFIGQCQGFQLDLQWLDEPIFKLLEDKMYCQLHDRIIVLFYPLDVTSSIFIKQLRNRFGDYPKLYLVMSGGDI